MRFCTTHRACESAYPGELRCVVASGLGDLTIDPCTLVDALIVEKVDGSFSDEQVEMFERIVHDYYVAQSKDNE